MRAVLFAWRSFRMERLPVAEPLRGSNFRGKAALNDGLGETDVQ